MLKLSLLGMLSGIVLTAAVARGELYNVNWVLVNTTLGGSQAPNYPQNVLSQPFWSVSSGNSVMTYDLLVETSPDDRFHSAQFSATSSEFYNSPAAGDVGPHVLAQIFPEYAYDSFVSGPAGTFSVAMTAGAMGPTTANPTWSYNPPTGSEVLGGRHRIARLTYRVSPLGIPQQTPATIRLASNPDVTYSMPGITFVDNGTTNWVRRVSGEWEDPFNWAGGLPWASMAWSDQFISQPLTTTLNVSFPTKYGLYFNSEHSVTIDGSGTINLAGFFGASTVGVTKGNHVVNTAVNFENSPTISVSASRSILLSKVVDTTAVLLKRGDGKLITNPVKAGGINVLAGTHALRGSTAAEVQTLTITGTGALDIETSGVVVNYSAASPLADLTSQVSAGRILTNTSGRVIGIAEASDFGTPTFLSRDVDTTAILLRSTLAGDADLSGTVNIGDFSVLAANFNSGSRWAQGDFNYSGLTDIADFALLAANFNQSVASRTAVPEPAFVGFAVFLPLLRRRR